MIPKFRAWDKGSKSMHQILEIIYSNDLSYISFITIGGGNLIYGPKRRSGDDFIIMQSTGLKDKNGVEIFEGDVLTSNVQPCKMVNPIKDGYGVVRFENGMFKLGAISLVTFISKMEVIGNIYENPELLEVK